MMDPWLADFLYCFGLYDGKEKASKKQVDELQAEVEELKKIIKKSEEKPK